MKIGVEISRFVPYLIGILFVISGAYKAVDPAEAVKALHKLGSADGVAAGIVFSAAVVELYFGFNLLRPKRQERFARSSVYLLGIFTVFLVVLKINGGTSCGCTGLEPLLAKILDP